MADERDGADPWEHQVFDDDFVRGATVREDDLRARRKKAERARRRDRRRTWLRRRAPQLVLLVVLVGLLGAGIAGVGPVARLFHTDPTEVTSAASATTRPAVSSNTSGTTTAPGGATTGTAIGGTSTTFGLTRRTYTFGDCVRWDQADGGPSQRNTEVVPCDQPHLLEIGGPFEVADRLGHYPSDEEWSQLDKESCTPFAEQLLGGPLDTAGRMTIGAVVPSEPGWSAGDRTIWCGVGLHNRLALPGEDPADFRPGSTTWFPPTSGTLRGQSQALVRPPGTCANEDAFAVPCSEPHTSEITGAVDLTGRTVTPPADGDVAGWSALVGDACRDATIAYLHRQLVPGETNYHYPIPARSWAAGRRIVECAAGRHFGGADQPMTGSLRDAH